MQSGWRKVTGATLLLAMFGGLPCAGPSRALAAAPEGDQDTVVTGNTDFALDLYDRLRTADGNLFLSPYSVSTALAMTYAGARGETARQMADVLRFSLEPGRLHPAFAALVATEREAGNGPGVRLHVANALWGQQGCGLLKEYLALNKAHYGAGLREVGFVHATEQARQAINAWVAEQTEQMIKELLQRGDLDPATTLVLTDAIYFKGDWAGPFDKEQTQDAPFQFNEQERIVVPMMHRLGNFGLVMTDAVDVLELPYAGDRLSMVVLLPKKVDGLAGLELSLSRANLERWLGQLRQQPVRVSLPRFQLETRFDLSETLHALGMTDAFDPARADFSGMTGRRELFISLVIHQAQIVVNEEGSEAAAGTAVVLKRGPRPADFTADHPFLFLIRDRETGSILFMGRVIRPR